MKIKYHALFYLLVYCVVQFCFRYLKSTYSIVEKHFHPDVLVYLGDLMDEGSISTRPQFHKYVKRLSNIFDPHYPVVVNIKSIPKKICYQF